MKKVYKAVILLLIITVLSVNMTGNAVTESTVSPALAVISSNVSLIKTGLCGEEITFEAEDFEDTLGCGQIETVVIVSLPSPDSGRLMLGSLEVTANQTISRANIPALRFIPSSDGEVSCSFMFRAGTAEEYDITCLMCTLKEKNFSPVAAGGKVTTYKNIAVYGSMTGSDPESDPLKYEVTSYPEKGVLAFSDLNGGGYIYTPMKNYMGSDRFKYTVTDAYGNKSDEQEVKIEIVRSGNDTVYTDLIGRKEHYGAIKLTDMGIISEGHKAGGKLYFDPDRTVSCAEFLRMTMQTLGINLYGESIAASGSDLLVPSSCRPYAALAREKGIVTENAFTDLTDDVTRAEACSAVASLIGVGNGTEVVEADDYSDSEKIPSWASGAVRALLDKEVIERDGGEFRPDDPLTAIEAVQMLTSLLEITGK